MSADARSPCNQVARPRNGRAAYCADVVADRAELVASRVPIPPVELRSTLPKIFT